MRWAHLPVAGGLYAQDPELLDAFEFIFAEKARHDEKEAKKKEAEQKRNKGSAGRGSRGRRR